MISTGFVFVWLAYNFYHAQRADWVIDVSRLIVSILVLCAALLFANGARIYIGWPPI